MESNYSGSVYYPLMKKEIKGIINTSRPLYWCVHFLFFVFGVLASGNFTSLTDIHFIFPLLLLTLPYSYFIYAVNDYYDDDSDHANSRKGGVFGVIHSKSERVKLLRRSYLSFLLCGIGFSFFGIKALIVYLILSADLFWYSAPPVRFKAIPILDFIAGGSLYGGLMYLLGYVTFQGNISQLIHQLPINLIFILVITAVYHLVLATFDISADRVQGITTSANVLGERVTLFSCIFILMGSLPFFHTKVNFFIDILVRASVCVFLFQPKIRTNRIVQKIVGEYSLYLSFILTLLILLISPSALN